MEPNVTLQHQPSSDTIGNAFKWPAILVSYLFHPVLVPLYCIAFIVYIHPSYFTGFSGKEKIYTLLISAVNLVFSTAYCIASKGAGLYQFHLHA